MLLSGYSSLCFKYFGGSLEGNQCDACLDNIEGLRECVNEKCIDVIDTLIATRDVLDTCRGNHLLPFWPQALQIFREKWLQMHKNLGVTIPNKIHVITDHFEEYIIMTNKPIGRISDEVVEAAHAAMNKRLKNSNYVVKDITDPKHGENLDRCIKHFNAYNI